MSTIVFTYDGTPIADVQWATATFESQMGGIPGSFQVTVKDEAQTYSFTTGKHITLTIDGSLYFGGIVTQVGRKLALPVDDTVTAGAAGVKTRQWVLRGVDYNIWFDKRVLFNKASPVDGIPDFTGSPDDFDVIQLAFTDYIDIADTSIDFTTFVEHVGNPYGTDSNRYVYDTPGTKIRELMNDIVQWTGAQYYFDHEQALHYQSLETSTPGWSFSDTPDRVTTFGFREFEYTEDGTNLVNDALVWGGAAWTSTGATSVVNFGRYTNSTSLSARGRWQIGEAHFNENGFASDANCAIHAKVIVEGAPGAAGAGLNDTVRGLVNPQKQVRMVWFSGTTPTPLIPGSVVTVALNTFGFTVVLPVRNIRVTFVTPSEARFEGFFGILTEDPWTLWKYMRKLQGDANVVTTEPVTVSDGSAPSPAGSTVTMEPTPATDGATTVFSVTDSYVAGSLRVWMNGLLQRPTIEYTESDPSAGEFTFTDAPLTGDSLFVEYISGG